MKSLRKHWKPMVLGFASVMFAALPVLADDTEIYFGTSNSSVKNNILFVIDTSGSMDSLDGTTTTRIDKLKTAFTTLLNSLDNVNIGLMRFSDPGGPILYPVTNISKTIPLSDASGVISKTVASGTDDGYQQNTAGTVDLSGSTLYLGKYTNTTTASYSITKTLSASANDADECVWATGTLVSSANTVDLTNQSVRNYAGTSGSTGTGVNSITCVSSGQREAGLIFTGITIPANAVIDSAYLSLVVSGIRGTSKSFNLTFYGEKASASTFSTVSGPYARWLSNRTSASAVWSFSGLPSVGAALTSANLSAIVQELASSSYLASGGNISLLFQDSSTTRNVDFYSYDNTTNSSYRPQLTINYHIDTVSSYDTTTALRFADVNLPRNAKITSAYLGFTAASSVAGTASFIIKGEASGNSTTLGTSSNNITSRSTTTASVPWNSSSTPALSDWTAGTIYPSPDVTSIVQELANRSDWCGGNALTLLLSGSGQRIPAAYDSGSSTAPTLVINYDPNSVPTDGTSCKKSTLTRQIKSSSDDAQEDAGTSNAQLTSTMLSLAATLTTTKTKKTTTTTGVTSDIGLRFSNLAIPKGATIQSATLQFDAMGSDSSSLDLTIYGEASDNSTTFTATNNGVDGRTRTSQSVSWSSVPSWSSGTWYSSPDVSTIVQALVNRSNWVPGNAMGFIITGSSNLNIRRAYSYDGSAGNAPKLTVSFIDNGSATSAQTYTVKDKLLEIVDAFTPGGYTPLQDTFYEGVQYFRGDSVKYGLKRGSGPYAYTRVSYPTSMVAGSYTSITPAGCTDSSDSTCKSETINGSPKYQSPITAACQKNHIVLLTDGLPNHDNSTALIKTLTGAGTCSYAGAGECMPELASWINKTADISSSYSGQQSITVDTISFFQDATSGNFLSDVAKAGGGLSESASSADELVAALEKIAGGTISEDTSFVAAGVSVNAFNRTLNRDDLYFSVFRPGAAPKWPGNVKKYKLAFDSSGNSYIKDANGVDAVDSKTGFFKNADPSTGQTAAKSFWSATADGSAVDQGGAGALITDYTKRKLYTDVGTSTDLSDPTNVLDVSNAALTGDTFGDSTMTSTYLQNLINWTRGQELDAVTAHDPSKDLNANAATRYVFADPLHSRPVAVTYGGTDTNPDITLYVSTNSGFLHAINDHDGSTSTTNDGKELFAYVPSDLLSLQKILFENSSGVDHPFGLDGPLTLWVIDPDGDGVVLNSSNTIETGNEVLLSLGMRRGGRNYYGFDVTDRNHPKLSWTINGGSTTGFSELGETWSQTTKARIQINGITKRVLIFAGGYDNNQDSTVIRATDSMGRAIYIVDAETGALIWSGGNGSSFTKSFSDMKYSIPSTVSAADINGDGLMDYFFVGDMGGQVWRFDINNSAADASTLITGGVIADLGVASGSNTAANNRRFFHAPSISAGKKSDGTPYLAIGIGSGWQAHPLNTDTTDKFYMIWQTDVFSAPSSYTKITESQLFNADADLIQVGTSAQQSTATSQLNAASGWYITMSNKGEKVLSAPVVINGEIIFTTYQPSVAVTADPCIPQTGTNRSYTMSVKDATATVDYTGDGALTAEDRMHVLNVPGIVDSTKLTCTTDGCATMQGASTAKKNMGTSDDMHRIYWYENRTR